MNFFLLDIVWSMGLFDGEIFDLVVFKLQNPDYHFKRSIQETLQYIIQLFNVSIYL